MITKKGKEKKKDSLKFKYLNIYMYIYILKSSFIKTINKNYFIILIFNN